MKEVSISKFDEAAKGRVRGKFEDEWNGLKIMVTPYLEPAAMATFVENVALSCFQGEHEDYHPEIKDFALRVATVSWFANIRMPEDNAHKGDMVYGTDIFDWLLDRIHPGQFNEIVAAVDRLVEFKMQTKQNDVRRELEAALDKIEQMADMFGAIIGEIDPEDIKKMAGAVKDGAVSEEKIVKAYMAEQKNAENQE